MTRSVQTVLLLGAVLFGYFIGDYQKESRTPKTFTWKIQSQAPEQNPDYQTLVEFTEKVKVMSQGRLIITPYSEAMITKGAELFSGVKEGITEMALGWPNWWLNQNIGWAAIQSGPYDFMNIDASMLYFYEGEGTKLANELSMSQGIIWRPAWWAGMELGILSRTKIEGLKDLKDKKIRIGPGIPADTLIEASGAFATPVTPEEIIPLANSGLLDGVEWTVPGATLSMGFAKSYPYLIAPAVWQPSVLADFLINKEAYNALPPDLQAILESAMKDYTLTTTLKSKNIDISAYRNFIEDGHDVATWSKEDLEVWKLTSDKVYKRYRDESDAFNTIYESKMRYKSNYDEYYKTFGAYD
ncbi:TRAP transporter substrate-binding protein DctP [Litoribrevibacter albus]|uniref:Exported solute-binding protein n=1 Tax=Litoribrevibacter albus TaxID=1473156 RepID=A0AA37S5F0_9GAMM|nr:TRAP transporter substrate-binding protein DctP [Litoribrevibacter albus]GLQ29601.1 exported solute-binding protein [Litoribrevibacter albus]